ncbi:coproporphyrinogen-III oxidase family protein [Saccharothrix xinjiangensis]|uniref:Heme chaperone HemW n=1 Tax=Saccharothrix xinjiangensis TaxID=204798 RepID=A0ABV9YFF9_9PSEU
MPGRTLMKFDRQLPFYNWLYPMKGQELDTVTHHDFHVGVRTEGVRSRALYVHIPFCDTICTFCTLNRGLGSTGDEQIELYVRALLLEIRLKGRYAAVTGIPIRAIFFGGGTPTTLSADQIRRIGRALHESFDLTALEEFTFEAEVKSVDDEKCAAMRDIGVNKIRFGLQSFDPLYRELFNVTATIDQEYAAVELFSRYFEHVSFDMIYGMHGQTFEQFSRDIEYATGMGTRTVELYPISNVVTQVSLHRGYADRGLAPLSFMHKMAMTIYLDQYLRASGFQQHNGHGFLRLPENAEPGPHFISRDYLNLYNTHTWSHYDDELIGLGNSAISQVGKYTVMNDENRASYAKRLLDDGDVKINITVGDDIPYERGIVLALPYFGHLDKKRVPWDHVPPEIVDKLGLLTQEGMLVEDDEEFRVTKLGWIWYVNMMYYLSPTSDQRVLDEFVALKRRVKGLTDGDTRMLPLLTGRVG